MTSFTTLISSALEASSLLRMRSILAGSSLAIFTPAPTGKSLVCQGRAYLRFPIRNDQLHEFLPLGCVLHPSPDAVLKAVDEVFEVFLLRWPHQQEHDVEEFFFGNREYLTAFALRLFCRRHWRTPHPPRLSLIHISEPTRLLSI